MMKARLAVQVLVSLLAGVLLLACSSSSNNSNAGNAENSNSGSSSGSSNAAKPTGAALDTCGYAKKFTDAFEPYTTALFGAGFLDPATPGPSTTATAVKAFQDVADATKTVIGALQAFNLPPELKAFNDPLVAALRDSQPALDQALAAAKQGDTAGASRFLDDASNKLQAAFSANSKIMPAVDAQLTACSTPAPTPAP